MVKKKPTKSEHLSTAASRAEQEEKRQHRHEQEALKKRIKEKLIQHKDNPKIGLLLHNIEELQQLDALVFKQLEITAVSGFLALTTLGLQQIHEGEALFTLALGIAILLFLISGWRFVASMNTSTKEEEAILQEFDGFGFSPINLSLEKLPTLWKGIESGSEILKCIQKVAVKIEEEELNMARRVRNLSEDEELNTFSDDSEFPSSQHAKNGVR